MTTWKAEDSQLVGEPPIFTKGAPGRMGVDLHKLDFDSPSNLEDLDANLLSDTPPALPELSELQVVRHFTRLSQLNASIDTQMYPLGSCTMKYNPRSGERAARLGGFAFAHPLEPVEFHPGTIRVMAELRDMLKAITGFEAVSLQPAAGAQGELCGLMMIRAALQKRGNARKKVLVPDSAHGTNPATSALNGYKVVPLKTGPEGYLKAETVQEAMDEDVAAIMMTNPNTLGIFERDIKAICDIVHEGGGFVYMDGANLNALLGIAQPASFGVDVMHMNLHKTFSTPHGGGGPGSGPVACTAELEPFLPTPVLAGEASAPYFDHDRPESIGKLRSFNGNFGMHIRAHSYISELGKEGLERVGRDNLVAANYVRACLQDLFQIAYDAPSMHEVVFTDKKQKEQSGVTTLDVAKRLIDHGFHPPTIYFPLIAPGAIMIEPTETEPLEAIDAFVASMRAIAQEVVDDPEKVKTAPHNAPCRRFDEATAARKPCLRHE